MPETGPTLEFLGSYEVRPSERIRSLDMSTGPVTSPGGDVREKSFRATAMPQRSVISPTESPSGRFRMLLSFERPARYASVRGRSRPWPAFVTAYLFADLENCTVTNVTGITERELRFSLKKITVKIVRAHGGCLGTKSR
jgi:hypothetical protein